MIETAVEKFAGKGAKAHMIRVGPTELYFTGNELFAIRRNGTLSITSDYLGHPGNNHKSALRRSLNLAWLDNRMDSRVFRNLAKESLGLHRNGDNVRELVYLDKFAGDGANAVALCLRGGKMFYFSYDHMIGFRDIDGTLTVSEDIWGRTVKRHIGVLEPEPENRMPRAEFEELADRELARFYLIPKVRMYRNVQNTR
jgi:hypothetical protein